MVVSQGSVQKCDDMDVCVSLQTTRSNQKGSTFTIAGAGTLGQTLASYIEIMLEQSSS